MYCTNCGNQIEGADAFCSNCGVPIQKIKCNMESNTCSKNGMAAASLVFGIVGLLAWIIPIIGLPIGITALVLGITGLNKSRKGMSIAGLVLGIICLILTIINSAIGAYQGYKGEAWFQKNSSSVTESKQEMRTNEFALKDKDGNILMTGGIKEASVIAVENSYGIKDFVVEIRFTDSATKVFEEITQSHIGESIGIYINDEMICNPYVQCAITDGICQITGTGSYEENDELAELLNTCK